MLAALALSMALSAASPAAAAAPDGSHSDADYVVVLDRFVDEEGRVDYAGLAENRAPLDAYVAALAEIDRQAFDTWPADYQIALLINAYNAFTLQAIVDHYPIRRGLRGSWWYPANSIRQIDGVWTELTFDLMGEQVTLDYIEHDWLRVDHDEPRIHMAVNCASIGCPPLRREPYRAAVLERQLDEQVERFLADPRFFRISRSLRVVTLSPLLHWYADDFTGYAPQRYADTEQAGEKGVIAFISRYMDESTAESLRTERYVVGYLGYDWSLNEQRPH